MEGYKKWHSCNVQARSRREVFNGKENERYSGVLHTLQEWITDEQKLEFLRKFGWLMKDEAVRSYSAKFKPQK